MKNLIKFVDCILKYIFVLNKVYKNNFMKLKTDSTDQLIYENDLLHPSGITPHIHFQLYSGGKRIDPNPFFNFD